MADPAPPDGYVEGEAPPPAPPSGYVEGVAPPITLADRFKSLLGDPDAQAKVMAANTSALRNSPAGGIAYGLRQPVDQARTMTTRGLQSMFPPAGSPAGDSSPPLAGALGLSGNEISDWATRQAQAAATSQANAQQNYEQNWRQGAPPSFDLGRIVGNAAAMAPLAYAVPGAFAAGLPARMAAGAIGGGMSGGAQAVDPNAPDYWSQVAKNAVAGTIGGAAVPAAFGALGSVISPAASTSPDIQFLRSMGVSPTIGKLGGPMAARYEQVGGNVIPFAGDFIKKGLRGAIGEWNDGQINRVLAPIGQALKPGLSDLTDKISDMQGKVGDAFDALVPRLGIPTEAVDPAANGIFQNGLAKIQADASAMPSDRAAQLNNIIKTRIIDRMSPGGGLTGETWKDADSFLNRMANNPRNGLIHSSDPDQYQLGEALNGTRQVMMDSLNAADPSVAPDLANAKAAYAEMIRVQGAAARAAKTQSPDIFTPAQYTAEVAKGSTTAQLGGGRALGQDAAGAASRILGNTVPDSGTPMGLHLAQGLGILGAGIAGHEAGVPLSVLGAGAGAGALTAALYSPAGRAALGRLLAARPAVAPPLAAGVRALAPAGAAAFAPAWGSLAGP